MKTGRRLRRFFSAQPLSGTGALATLSSEETRHLRTTLRLKIGDRCFVTDGGGREAEAVIAEFLATGEARVRIETLREAPASSLKVRIGQALLQRGVMEDLVRKAQELGVSGVFPIETERSLKLAPDQRIKMLTRWRKIAAEAAKQSGSLQVLEISEPKKCAEVLKEIDPKEQVVFFHPHGEGISFRDWMDSLTMTTLHLFFGPEGGFSEKEIQSAVQTRLAVGGQKPVFVKLGANILKADTAFLGVASALRFLFS